MKNTSWWYSFSGRVATRLAVLAGVFLLAMGIGAATVLLYENGLPLSAGASPRQQDPPAPGGEPEKEPEVAAGGEQERAEGSGDKEERGVSEAGGGEQEDTPEAGEAPNVGVWYSAATRRWTIFNQDLSEMPEGEVFEVYVFPPSDLAFIHEATADNTFGESTYIDSIATDGNPDAPLSVTQNWSSGGAGGVYNDHGVEPRYDAEARRWTIANEDGEEIPEGALFNVGVFPLAEPTLVHETGGENTSENWTYLDHPLANGDPDAVIFVVRR